MIAFDFVDVWSNLLKKDKPKCRCLIMCFMCRICTNYVCYFATGFVSISTMGLCRDWYVYNTWYWLSVIKEIQYIYIYNIWSWYRVAVKIKILLYIESFPFSATLYFHAYISLITAALHYFGDSDYSVLLFSDYRQRKDAASEQKYSIAFYT